ncbi:hypothetical protein EJ08DRAFT_712982 [Tothia fuscella]|uniref:Uncharacterized protein n=1 Tax=Tothia fuscella TaxID=1048955 RepID=A0A9P4U062_9PEZI|nr:hypothetical protein EJ08DRAFT_712982 [Tothia fuscella]
MAIRYWIPMTVAFLGSLALASTVPSHGYISRDGPPDPGTPGTAGSPTIEVQQLVAGLGFNVMAQKGELAVASVMQSLLQAPTPDPALFTIAKDDMLAFMSAGMRIRANNMQLSKVNPQVTRGLAQLEQTQVLQIALVNNLTGNAAADVPKLERLQGEIEAAVQRNQGLQSLATGGSSIPMATKMATP